MEFQRGNLQSCGSRQWPEISCSFFVFQQLRAEPWVHHAGATVLREQELALGKSVHHTKALWKAQLPRAPRLPGEGGRLGDVCKWPWVQSSDLLPANGCPSGFLMEKRGASLLISAGSNLRPAAQEIYAGHDASKAFPEVKG